MKNQLRKITSLRLAYRLMRGHYQTYRLRLPDVSPTNDIKAPIDIARDLVMGEYGFIGKGAWICPNVIMGNYVMIAPECAILGGDHRFDIAGVPTIFSGRPEAPVTRIEDDVWIGYRVIIMAGVTIGRGAVIAAGSLVTKDVPAFSVCGGSPCKVIKERFTAEEQELHIAMLNQPPCAGNYAMPKAIKQAK
jgi:acetyltransferase-like isoleucine patch superfamily enzyme